MKQYLQLMAQVLSEGEERKDRTGVGTTSIFGGRMSFDLRQGFPLVTCKKTSFKNIAVELLWFLSGSTNVNDLHKDGCTIWDEWADSNGDLGPTYGQQWRDWGGLGKIDQIAKLQETLRIDPFSRRAILSAWKVDPLSLWRWRSNMRILALIIFLFLPSLSMASSCLTKITNIVYREARESYDIADRVISVILTRAKKDEVTPCQVVNNSSQWARKRVRPGKDYKYLKQRVAKFLDGTYKPVLVATHFHGKHMKKYPEWSSVYAVVGSFNKDNHIYYMSNEYAENKETEEGQG